MKVHFTASIIGKRQHEKNYRRIVELLRKKGHTVIAEHILDTSEAHLSQVTKEQRLAFHDQLVTWINDADFVVVESSFSSISVGYEVSLALSRGKPVLMLHTKGTEAPSLLEHFKSEQFLCEEYTDATVEETIDQFINYVKGAADTRFTFFITPAIMNFLEEVSREEKVPKSVYLRRLITQDMQKRLT